MPPARWSLGLFLSYSTPTPGASGHPEPCQPCRGPALFSLFTDTSISGLLCGTTPPLPVRNLNVHEHCSYGVQHPAIGHLGPRQEGGRPLLLDPKPLEVAGVVSPGCAWRLPERLCPPRARRLGTAASQPESPSAPRLDPTAALKSVPCLGLGFQTPRSQRFIRTCFQEAQQKHSQGQSRDRDTLACKMRPVLREWRQSHCPHRTPVPVAGQVPGAWGQGTGAAVGSPDPRAQSERRTTAAALREEGPHPLTSA